MKSSIFFIVVPLLVNSQENHTADLELVIDSSQSQKAAATDSSPKAPIPSSVSINSHNSLKKEDTTVFTRGNHTFIYTHSHRNENHFYLKGNFGLHSSNIGGGPLYGLELNYRFKNYLVSSIYEAAPDLSHILSFPNPYNVTGALLLGKILFEDNIAECNARMGLGFSKIVTQGKLINNSFIFSEYETISNYTISLPCSFEFDLRSKFVGMGINCTANFNFYRSYGGLMLYLIIGKLH